MKYYSHHKYTQVMTTKKSIEQYEVLGCLVLQGNGSFGKCKKIRKKSSRKIKMWKEVPCFNMTMAEKQALIADLEFFCSFRHPFMLRCSDYIDDRISGIMYIILEHCENGNLVDVINTCRKNGRFLDERFVWKALYQISSAVQECRNLYKRKKAPLHYDLRPLNIFIDAHWNMKLGNLGLIQLYDVDSTVGSGPCYLPPEKAEHIHNEKSDVWSLGCIIYELCSLKPPFSAGNWMQLVSRIKCGVKNSIPLQYSPTLQDTIGSMLAVKEDKRPSLLNVLHIARIHTKTTKHVKPSNETVLKDKLHKLKEKEDLLRLKELNLQERTSEIERFEKNLCQKMEEFKEQVQRVERFMEVMQTSNLVPANSTSVLNPARVALNDLPAYKERSKSLDRNLFEKKKVKFKLGSENKSDEDKENRVLETTFNSPMQHFEKRKHRLEQRLEFAQFRALELREEEINSRFTTKVNKGLKESNL